MTTKLTKLLQSELTVFTLNDLGIIWGQKYRSATRQSARDYASLGNIVRLHQGVYALPDVWPDDFKLANRLLASCAQIYENAWVAKAAATLRSQYAWPRETPAGRQAAAARALIHTNKRRA